MIVDTHTHLYLPEFDNPAQAVTRALEAGVGHMLFPNVDRTTVEPMMKLHDEFADVTSVAMGLHPTEIGPTWIDDLAAIEAEWTARRHFVAVGEIGIDLYWDKTYEREQCDAFARQIRWATDRDLPIIIHCRDGLDRVLEVLDGAETMPRGVFHSFGGTADDVERIRRRGDFYFGINGIVTFKNSRLRDVLPSIGVQRILLETDSPYLAPVPHRGHRNESAYIVHTCAHIASVLGITNEAVAEITTASAKKLFGLSF